MNRNDFKCTYVSKTGVVIGVADGSTIFDAFDSPALRVLNVHSSEHYNASQFSSTIVVNGEYYIVDGEFEICYSGSNIAYNLRRTSDILHFKYTTKKLKDGELLESIYYNPLQVVDLESVRFLLSAIKRSKKIKDN